MTLSEPQTWTIMGVFAAAMFGALGLIVPLINRSTRAAIGELRGEMNGLRGETAGAIDRLRGEMLGGFQAVDARFEAVDAKFVAVNVRLDHLERDVSAIGRKVFGVSD